MGLQRSDLVLVGGTSSKWGKNGIGEGICEANGERQKPVPKWLSGHELAKLAGTALRRAQPVLAKGFWTDQPLLVEMVPVERGGVAGKAPRVYARELNAPITGTAMNADSPLRRFEGKAIEAHPDMPRGSVAFTPLKNLVYGISTDMRRDRSYHSRKRVLEYTFDIANDYEVAVKQAAVLGE